MHKKIKITAAILILAAAAAAIYSGLSARPSAERLTTLQQGPITQSFTETAELRSRQNAGIYITSAQSIATVHTAVGESVSAGDILVTYKSTHDLQLEQLQAQRQAAQAQYAALFADAQLQLESMTLSLAEAQKQYDRQQQLFAAGALSQQQLDETAHSLDLLRHQHASAQAALQAAQTQEQAQLAQIDASLSMLAQQNEDAIVIAPFDGIITECPATAGATLPMNSLVIEIQDRNQLYLHTELLMEDAALLTDTTSVTISNDSYKITINDLSVSAISPKALNTISALGVEQKRLPVEIALSSPVSAPLGSEWDVTFILATEPDALWLPKAYIYNREGTDYVLLADGKTEKAITTGIRQDNKIQITDGLALGDQVALPQ